MKNSLLRRVLVFITVSSIIAQSFSPYVAILSQRAYAQEVTDQSTTTETQTTTVEQTTPAPENTNPTPSEEQVVATETVTPAPTDTPTETVTPAPTDTPTEVTPTEVNNNSPPSENTNTSENQGIDTSFTPTETPVTLTPTQEGLTTATENPKDEQLNLILLDNVSAPSIDLEAVESEGSAVLTTDKPDYAPTDSALITGSNLLPNTTYTLRIWSDDAPATSTSVQVTSDENGVFAYAYQLDGIYRPNYSAELKDSSGTVVATVTFTDSAANLDHCRNGSASSPSSCTDVGGPTGWENGNAGASNSHYVEGLSIPYRLVLTGLSIGTHTVVLGYDIKHSDAHAIDFLTHYNRLEPHSPFGHSAETINPTDGISGISATTTTFAIPTPSSVGSPIAGQPTTRFNSLPAVEKLMTLFGGTITGVSYVTQGDLNDSQSETRIQINFTVDSTTSVLSWGGHIAREIDWGLNKSAGGISGSPYHMRLIDLDGSGGNQDRSLSADAIEAPSSITIVKDAQPNDSQDFAFTTTGNGLSSFSLDDDSDNTLSNSTTFSSLLAGSYSVTESLVNGWTLDSKSCVTDGTTNTTSTFGQITNGVSINLVAGENVTCTFINKKDNGSIKVNKVVDANDDGTYEGDNTTATNLGFTWSLDGSGTNSFGSTISNVNTGSHNVNENLNSQPYHFVGWFPTGSTQYSCTNPQGTTLPISVNVANNTLTEITLCNAANKGHLIVQKTTVPSADQTVFTINATGNGTITNGGAGTVTDASDKDYEVTPGTYSVSETVPAGWSKTGDTCQNVAVAAGQTVYCLLTNTKLGSITVVKNTNFGNGVFPFSTTGGLDPVNFNITTSGGTGSKLYSDVLPGNYSVTENTPASWTQGTISCVDGTDPIGTINGSTASFTLIAGHNVICTFNNTGQGQLKIVKNTIGGNDTFGFTVSGPTPLTPSVLTSNGTGNTGFNTVTAGNYSVSETSIPNDWTLTGTSCTNGQASLNPASFDINAGDSVTCTFENTRDTGTIELKKVWVGTAGTVTLNIGTTNEGDEVDTELVSGTDGTTGQNNVITGTYFMSESALPDYTTGALSCFNDANDNGRNDNESSVTVGSNDSISVSKNQHVICTYTNTRNQGTIELKKVWVGTAGQTTLNIGTNSEVTDVASVQTGANGDDPLTTGTKTVDTGTYYVSETGGLTNYTSSLECTDNGNSVNPGNNNSLTVEKDHEVVCTFTNTRDTGTIEIVKNTIGGDNTFEFEIDGLTNSNPSITTVGGTGTTGALTVEAGTYSVSELESELPFGWTLVSLICEKNKDNVDSTEFSVSGGDSIICTATNKRDTGRIIVRKLIDEDGSLNTTNDQTAGQNWEFDINGTGSDTSNPSVSPTDSNGETTSGDINTGEYTVKETIKEGYRILSASCEESQNQESLDNDDPLTQGEFDNNDSVTGVFVALDTTVVCEFINTLTLPKLVISKSNNAVGNKSPNDTVGFTITIAAEETGGAADNVKVIDLLPKGFVFNSSSWKVVSSDITRGDNGDITALLTTPTYASPGTWNLGHLNSGETLTLTYNATIDGAQQTGTYYDNAWGQGNPVGGTDVIFARAIDPGDLDAADPSEFVGTEVSIVNPNQPGVDYNATSTREVLGASTYLPATGENTLWVIIATLLSVLGFGSITLGVKLRKKYE